MSGDVTESHLRQLCDELERRLRSGERFVAEEYLSRSEIVADEEHALELIYRELTVLEELGERPSSAAFVQRFPDWADGIHRLLEVHDAFSEHDTTVNSEVRIFDPVGTVIDKYKVLQEIGEGGFGIVYMAEQQEPVRRKVALKIIKPGMDTRAAVARFEAERQALAMMEHPNISRVLDAGATANGRPYFVMDLVKGIPITDFCDKRNLSTVKRLQLFKTVCEAVQHAHSKGIIHRDLKPSNVMITLHDGTPVPRIIDFGIAKALNQQLTDKTLFTRYGQMLGTPMYMSPEQAEMSGLDIDIRSDVYSLGVLLYELLTGTPPLTEETVRTAAYSDLVRIIMEDDPPTPSSRLLTLGETLSDVCDHRDTNPRRLASLLQGDLDRIVMKALEKDRTRRYETVSDFARDVDRYLNDKPVVASSPSTFYRIQKFTRRNRALVLSTSAVLLALTLGFLLAVAGLFSARQQQSLALAAEARERDQRERAEYEESNAKLARDNERVQRERVETSLYFHQIARAHREWQSGKLRNAAQILNECSEEKREWEWHYLRRLCDSSEKTMRGHSSLVHRTQISPDGKWIASASSRWHDRRPGEVIIWNRISGEPVHFVGRQPFGIREIAFSPNSHLLAAVNNARGGIHVWDVVTGSTVFAHSNRSFEGVCFSPDSKNVAAAGVDGRVHIYDAQTGRSIRVIGNASSQLFDVAYHPSGDFIAAVTHSSELAVWDSGSGQLLHRFERAGNRAVDFSPDGKLIATGGYSGATAGRLQVYEIREGVVRELVEHTTNFGAIGSLVFSPDSQFLALTSTDAQVRFWDPRSGHQLNAFRAHDGVVAGLGFGPDARQLVTGGTDKTVKLWTLSRADPGSIDRTDYAFATALAFSPDNRHVAFAGGLNLSAPGRGSQSVQLWELPEEGDRDLKGELLGLEQWMSSLVYSPDGSHIAAGGDRGGVCVWDTVRYRKVVGFQFQSSPVKCLIYSADGLDLIAGGGDGMMRVADSRSGRIHQDWSAHAMRINCIQRHPTTDAIASVGEDGHFKLWDVASATLLQSEIPTKDAALTYVAFSADGAWGATGDVEGNIHLWQAADNASQRFDPTAGGLTPHYTLVHKFAAHKDRVVGLSFHPSGTRLASLGMDGSVVLWDTNSKQEAIRMRPFGQNQHVLAIAFSPDGHRLIASRSNHVSHWNAAPRRTGDPSSRVDQQQTLTWHRQQIDSCSQQGNWFGVRFHCNVLLEREPDNANFLALRGSAFAAQGDWQLAINDCARARELGSKQIDDQYALALIQLKLGDVEGYRGTCRAVLASLIDPTSDSRFNLALVSRICALAPDAVQDLKLTIGFLKKVADRSRGYARHIYQNTLGLILLRTGKFQEAIDNVADGLTHAPGKENPSDWLILALANQKLGNNEIASIWFEQAAWAIERQGFDEAQNRHDWKVQTETRMLRDEVANAMQDSDTENWKQLSPHERQRVAWNLNGLLNAERNRDFLAAVEHASGLIEVRPHVSEFYIRRSRAYAMLAVDHPEQISLSDRCWEKAKQDFRQAIILRDDDPSSGALLVNSKPTAMPHVPIDMFETHSIESWKTGDWQQTMALPNASAPLDFEPVPSL